VYRLTAEINTIKANCDNGDDNTDWKTHFGTSNFSFFWPKPSEQPEQVQIQSSVRHGEGKILVFIYANFSLGRQMKNMWQWRCFDVNDVGKR